jgi:hypothetical protein
MRFIRQIHLTVYQLAKSSTRPTDIKILQHAVKEHNKPENLALTAYHYFETLKTHSNPILTSEYKQLPDDSQFIDKHYTDLVYFRDKICGIGGRYQDILDVSDLFLRLSKHQPQNQSGRAIFDQFVEDLIHVMKLNGGHLFVLDLLIYNKEVFDHCEKIHHVL